MADAPIPTETPVTTTTTEAAPPPSPAAAAAAKGDFAAFTEARERDQRGEREAKTTPVEPAKETPATTEPGTSPAPTTEEAEAAAEAAKTSEAAKTLAETKSRREKRRQSIQDEIDELTKTRSAMRREFEADQARLAAVRQEALALSAKSETPAATAEDPEPNPDQFDTYEKYVRAAGRWEARQESRRLQAEVDKKLEGDRKSRENAALERGRQDIIAQHNARMVAARTAHPDYDAAIAANEDLRVPPALYEAIPFSPVGAEVMYHLAKNPDVADALLDLPISAPMRDAIMDSTATLAPKLLSYLAEHPDECKRIASTPDPRAQLRAMGRLEARLDVAPSGPTPAAKPVTSAPPPIKPVGSSATATTLSTRDLAQQGRGREFMERRDREERERKIRRA
jgi:hypothetical protein